jgi:hypothetical protein
MMAARTVRSAAQRIVADGNSSRRCGNPIYRNNATRPANESQLRSSFSRWKPRTTMVIVQAFADKRLNSSAQAWTTTICLEVFLSWSSSLIIRKRLPSAVTS